MTKLPVSEPEHLKIALRVHTALAMMAAGQATLEEWRDLSDAINVTESLCDMGKLDRDELDGCFDLAMSGMAEAIECQAEGGRMRMNERTLEALKRLVSEYDCAVGKFSRGTMATAQARVVLKVASAKQRPDPSVRVVSP